MNGLILMTALTCATTSSITEARKIACDPSTKLGGPLIGWLDGVSVQGRIGAIRRIAYTDGDPVYAWSIAITTRTDDPCMAYGPWSTDPGWPLPKR